ncbi:type IV toxin-antitoxin system AbiEi family antitoxin domain-containing protein [Gordonia sp. TBRC 11910]|uniref:Type IV toxin-antitoxin system AbiEi family antitoxin domain-containing protein n=1 Tax=Gordonia asplenii TaxID=2725283 RepID=A0A848KZZ3_9ACTN|nr:type IV toxin-antitoxin system AbiEi family antitoxin domain-containing protein [Gordonia asplenii]NMO04280.1 type IV toxin-antitoxin system AbiEi family antitoxin domain-containing protein [Gordonia asplenii]
MAMDSGVFTIAELVALGWPPTEIRRAQRAQRLISIGRGWVRTDAAHPDVVSAVMAGGALSCVGALSFHKQHRWPKIWIPSGYSDTHVRRSKHMKTTARPTGPFHWCQGYGRPLPVTAAVDSVAVAVGCAARCVTGEEWIAIVDSILNSTEITIPDLQADMGRVTQTVSRLFARCDARSQSGTESIARLRLISAGFSVEVQPSISRHEHADLAVGALLIECDGKLYHSDEASYRNDRRRDRMTLIDRWMTMRLTYDDVLYDWAGVLEDIRSVTRQDRHRIRRTDDPRRKHASPS